MPTRRSFLAALAALPFVPRVLREKLARTYHWEGHSWTVRPPFPAVTSPEAARELAMRSMRAQVSFGDEVPRYLRMRYTVTGGDVACNATLQVSRNGGRWENIAHDFPVQSFLHPQ